jgi:hypothetical protein
MSTISIKELSHPSGEVIKIASGKTLDLKTQGSVTMPTGSVLQVVDAGALTALYFTDVNTSHTVGSVTITPSSATSKIMVFVNLQIWNGNATSFVCSINSGGSEVFRFSEINIAGRFGTSGQYLHSPNTTSPVTYDLAMIKESSNTGNTGNINTQHNHLYAMEIQG